MTTRSLAMAFGICFLIVCGKVEAQIENIHPYNRALMKLYPRPFPLKYPEVPRISGAEALGLYKGGNGLFVRVGAEGAVVPGALYGKEMHNADPSKIGRIAGGRVIVVY